MPEIIWLPTRPAVDSLRDLLGQHSLTVLPTLRTLAWDPDLDGPLPGLPVAPPALEDAAWLEATQAYWPPMPPAALVEQAHTNRRLAARLMWTGCTQDIFEARLAEAGQSPEGAPRPERLRQAWEQVNNWLTDAGYATLASGRVTAQKLLTERMPLRQGGQLMAGFSELAGCEKPLVNACLARADGQLVLAGRHEDPLLRTLLDDLAWDGPLETVEAEPRTVLLSWVEAPRPFAEARAVSRAIRRAWQDGLRDLAVVCPDETYRQRVAAQLRRDGVAVKNEIRLEATPAGQLVTRLAALAAGPEPVALAALGSLPVLEDFADWAALDRLVWRGVALDAWDEWQDKALHLPSEQAHSLAEMVRRLADIFSVVQASGMPLAAWATWLTDALQAMAPAWQSLHGARALGGWLDEMRTTSTGVEMAPATWAIWVRKQLEGRRLHIADAGGGMPQAEVLAPTAARLRAFGMVIIGGGNEGIWPASPPSDNLTASQRQIMGLPENMHHARISGHDWHALLTAAPEVLCCRSLTDAGAPTLASRWWNPDLGKPMTELLTEDHDVMTAPKALGAWPPLADAWPEGWSATWIRRLMGCPYRAVGEGLMRLNALEDYGGIPDKATTGTLVHRWVEAFWQQQPGWPAAWDGPLTTTEKPRAVACMGDIIRHGLRDEPDLVQRLWAPRIDPLSHALVSGWIADHAAGRTPAMLEHGLVAPLAGIFLRSRADRVDRDREGHCIVIDYKTGSVPGMAEMNAGREPQLALEGWLLRQAGETLEHAEYWRLKGYGETPLERRPVKTGDFERQVTAVSEHLPKVVGAFGRQAIFRATPEPGGVCDTCQLAGLCRWRESHP